MHRLKVRVLVIGTALWSCCARAHVDDAGGPGAWDWSFEPLVIGCLLLSAVLYASGLWRLWRHARPGHGASPRQALAFWAGWLVLVIALVSPLDRLGIHLFSAHMVQHELLMVAAAPLLVCGRPLGVWAWALQAGASRAIGHALHGHAWRSAWLAISAPLSAWALHAIALWGWHLPQLFDRALASNGWHTLQHTCFLGSALLFWWSLLRPNRRAAHGAAMLLLFTTMLHTGALGALLALSSQPWYQPYLATTSAFGLDALEDQQLGGLVMWVPAGLVYLLVGLMAAARWGNLVGRTARGDRA